LIIIIEMIIQLNASRSDILKNLPLFIQSNSLRDRSLLFDHLIKYINEKQIEGLYQSIIHLVIHSFIH
jgi:hypothetical protein